MYTVGRLGKKHGLSRSTLLYYDRIGLLCPSGHAKGEYRQYSDADDARLAKICEYRKAGIALADIGRMLDDAAETSIADALEERLIQLNAEMVALKDQQSLVAGLLGRADLLNEHSTMDKATWVSLLSAAGFSEDDMRRWHVQFERSAPDRHEEFLRHLSIPDNEISAIRSMAAAPHTILNINKESGKFMEMFFKIYEGLDREGPGSSEMTKRAFDLCEGLPEAPAILELGCGTGGATIHLANLCEGTIVATDVYQPFLDRLIKRAEINEVADKVAAAIMDMGDLDFGPESFDLIWCEGAAYIMGVDKAFQYWKQFLKPGGCLVISDAVWLSREIQETAPDEVKAFWAEGYPVMRTAEENALAGESHGYTSLGHFTINTECWDDFYNDVGNRMNNIESVYGDNPDGRAIIDITRKEIAQYREYPGTYGYEMHVFRK